jgi:hypothetical protein
MASRRTERGMSPVTGRRSSAGQSARLCVSDERVGPKVRELLRFAEVFRRGRGRPAPPIAQSRAVHPFLNEAHLVVPARQVAAAFVLGGQGDFRLGELQAGLGSRGDEHPADPVAALARVDAEIGNFDRALVARVDHDRSNLTSTAASRETVGAGAGADRRRNPHRR